MAEAETALELAKAITWGTYGLGAIEAYETRGTPLPPLTWKPLGECDSDHLEEIIKHVKVRRIPGWKGQSDSSELVTIACRLILEDRK